MTNEEVELVMKAISDLQKPPYISEVKSDKIAEKTGLNHQKVKDVLDVLQSKSRVKIFKLTADRWGVFLTVRGLAYAEILGFLNTRLNRLTIDDTI